jgi:opacity protein-like surface antigen
MKLFAGLATLLLLTVSAFAADVDGKWAGTISIKEGKIDGANISFTVTLDFGGMPFTLTYKGVVAKDNIKFNVDAAGMPMEVTVKKA